MKKSESMLKNFWGKLLDDFLTITILPFSGFDWTVQVSGDRYATACYVHEYVCAC